MELHVFKEDIGRLGWIVFRRKQANVFSAK